MQKIAYASLSALGEDFHRAFDAALDQVRRKSGRTFPMFIGGKGKKGSGGVFPDASPSDTGLVLGRFQIGDCGDARKAIEAARASYPAWRARGWAPSTIAARTVTISSHPR